MAVDVDRDGAVATVTLNRPETRNALSDALLADVVGALRELDGDRGVGCIVLAGQERFFSAGADLGELSAREPTDIFLGRRAELWQAIRNVRLPMVAAVSGHCLGGGCELALSCDLVEAARTARFGQPETSLGLIAGGGGSQFLVGLVGRAVAADMVLTGRVLDAEEAFQRGIVARLCEADWREQAHHVASAIAARPRVGVLLAKRALWKALELPLSGGIALERASYQVALASYDARERLAAFADRREPQWEGR